MQHAGDPLASPSCAESIDLVDAALVRLVRRLTDSRMTQTVNAWAGVDVERSGFTLMSGSRTHLMPDSISSPRWPTSMPRPPAGQIAKLIDQGLAERSSDPANHRVRRHRLTKSGSEALIRLRRARHDWIAQSVADFTPAEQRDLADLLTRFVDNFPPQPT